MSINSASSWVSLFLLTWRLLSVFSDILKEPCIMVFVSPQVPWPSLLSLMQIGQGTLLIDTPLLAYWSFLVLIPFHGLRRNKTLCIDHLQRLSTGHWLLLLLSFLGFEFCSRSSRFFFLIYLLSGVIMFLPNLVFHSKTKHLEVDYHFIPRQAYWDSCIKLVSHVLGALH